MVVIKAIIFDYTGVLSVESILRSFGDRYAPKFGKDPEEFKKLFIDNWLQARVNKINSSVFWENLANFLEVDKETFRKDFMDFLGFRPEVYELIKHLKKREYKLGLLSNHIEDWLEEIIENHKLDEIFDVIVTSYKSGVAKPDISIFNEIVEKLEVNPNECVYIDDMEKNIPPAKKLGMKTILFTDLENLKKDLASLNVKLD